MFDEQQNTFVLPLVSTSELSKYVTVYAKTVPIGTTIEIHLMA